MMPLYYFPRAQAFEVLNHYGLLVMCSNKYLRFQSIFFSIASGKNTSTQSWHRYSTSPLKNRSSKVSPQSKEKFCFSLLGSFPIFTFFFAKTKIFLCSNQPSQRGFQFSSEPTRIYQSDKKANNENRIDLNYDSVRISTQKHLVEFQRRFSSEFKVLLVIDTLLYADKLLDCLATP